MDTLHTFWDNITNYETESVDFLGLMNSATKRLGVQRSRVGCALHASLVAVSSSRRLPPVTRIVGKPNPQNPRDLRTHILRLLGPKAILYEAFGLG